MAASSGCRILCRFFRGGPLREVGGGATARGGQGFELRGPRMERREEQGDECCKKWRGFEAIKGRRRPGFVSAGGRGRRRPDFHHHAAAVVAEEDYNGGEVRTPDFQRPYSLR